MLVARWISVRWFRGQAKFSGPSPITSREDFRQIDAFVALCCEARREVSGGNRVGKASARIIEADVVDRPGWIRGEVGAACSVSQQWAFWHGYSAALELAHRQRCPRLAS
jgi:hypothetical protein